MSIISPINFKDNCLILLDQRELPLKEVTLKCESLEDVHVAIKNMVVRGAPCIGFSGIYALALWFKTNKYNESKFFNAAKYLITARPTAVNLEYEVLSCIKDIKLLEDKDLCFDFLVTRAKSKMEESEAKHLKMANLGLEELKSIYGNRKLNILTHCNTGFLACGSLGTALGMIEVLAKHEMIENVWVDETRPYLQGSRLTSYELTKLNIPHQVVVEGSASYLMMNNMVDAVLVGADRIALNGDTANKVGTSSLCVLANHYEVPFYVVAPVSSFDFSINSGDVIDIELRDDDEILSYNNKQIAPKVAKAFNPSFDISKGDLITRIICERGSLKKPYLESIGTVRNE